jgi:hypothetical protein
MIAVTSFIQYSPWHSFETGEISAKHYAPIWGIHKMLTNPIGIFVNVDSAFDLSYGDRDFDRWIPGFSNRVSNGKTVRLK